jgi:hypothetical protein
VRRGGGSHRGFQAGLVTFLRLILNAVFAAVVAAAGVMLLVFAVNPDLPLGPTEVAGVALGLLPLVVPFGLVWPLLLLLLQVFAVGRIGLGVLSFKYFRRFLVADLLLLALCLAYNEAALAGVLDAPGAARLRLLSRVTLAVLMLLVVEAWAEGRLARRPRAWLPSLAALRRGTTVALAITAALTAGWVLRRAPPVARPSPGAPADRTGEGEIVILAIDGLGPEPLFRLIEEGRLPNFARLTREGARGVLEGSSPGHPVTLWTTFGTGRPAPEHGVVDAALYRFPFMGSQVRILPRGVLLRRLESVGLLSQQPVDHHARRVSAFEDIFPRYGMPVGLVGFWAGGPPAPGGLTIDAGVLSGDVPVERGVRPRHLAPVVAQWVLGPERIGRDEVTGFFDPPLDGLSDLAERKRLLRRSLARDRSARQVTRALTALRPLRVTAVAMPGYDEVAHRFLGEAPQTRASLVRGEEVRATGQVVARYVRELDVAVGEQLARAGPDTLLVVASPHGLIPTGLARRLRDRVAGETTRTAHHEVAADGVLFLWGGGIAADRDLGRIPTHGVLPTLLYATGLPLDSAMRLPEGIFAAFTEEFLETHGRVSFIEHH